MRNDADYQIMLEQFPVRVLSLSTPRFQHPQKASNYACESHWGSLPQRVIPKGPIPAAYGAVLVRRKQYFTQRVISHANRLNRKLIHVQA